MKKILPLLLLFVLVPFMYHGAHYLFDRTITKISVSRSIDFGAVNPDFFAVFTDRPTLGLFKRALAKAEKHDLGNVYLAHPDYDVEIRYSDGSTMALQMWLLPEVVAGSVMHVTNKSTIYTLPRDIAGELIALLEPYAAQIPDERRDAADADQPTGPAVEPDAGGTADADREADAFALVVNGVAVPLGAWDNELEPEAILGPAVSQSVETLENADTYTGSFVKNLDYEGLRLELFSPKQNGETFRIMSMQVFGEGYETPEGIGVGSTLDELLAAYPGIGLAPDGRTDPGNAAYQMGDAMNERFLRFEVANDRVTEIRLDLVLP